MSTHHAKFARLHCKANQTAKDAAPMIATKLVVSIPIMPATVMSNMTFRITVMRLSTNFLSPFSTFAFLSAASASFSASQISFRHHNNTTMASRIFGPKVITFSIIIGITSFIYRGDNIKTLHFFRRCYAEDM